MKIMGRSLDLWVEDPAHQLRNVRRFDPPHVTGNIRRDSMTWIVCLGSALGCFLLASRTLDLDLVGRSPLLRKRGEALPPEREREGRQLSRKNILLLAALLGVCGGLSAWRTMEITADVLTRLKVLVGLFGLVGAGCVDALEHRIPNVFPAGMGGSALLLLALGFAAGQEGAAGYAFSSLFAAGVCTLGLLAASLLTHGGIGGGDIKLVGALGLLSGVYTVVYTLFFAMLLCALTAAALLLTKKKTIKEALPFGPFLLAGYMITLWTAPF